MTAIDVHQLAEQLAPLIVEHNTLPPLLNADQAGELLNVPASWVLAEARSNRIPHLRLGRYVRFKTDTLTAWIEGRST